MRRREEEQEQQEHQEQKEHQEQERVEKAEENPLAEISPSETGANPRQGPDRSGYRREGESVTDRRPAARRAPTRRSYLRTGGAAIGGGLLAGCSDRIGTGEPPGDTGTPESAQESSYSVTVAPVGTVEFDAVPETWIPYTADYADMGVALGRGDGLAAIGVRARFEKKGEERVEEEGEENGGFVVSTQDGRRVTARRVVAATRYDGSYLRPLDSEAMFDRVEHDGEAHERLDRAYADHDGRTPVGGLYVASPSHETDRQAIVAAGRGARVGIAVVEDARRARGYPDAVSDRYDWVRRDVQRDDEWRDRDRWRERYGERVPGDHDLDDGTLGALLEREIDRRLDSYLTPAEIETRTERGQRRLPEHLDDGLVLDRAREIRTESPPEEVSDWPWRARPDPPGRAPTTRRVGGG